MFSLYSENPRILQNSVILEEILKLVIGLLIQEPKESISMETSFMVSKKGQVVKRHAKNSTKSRLSTYRIHSLFSFYKVVETLVTSNMGGLYTLFFGLLGLTR